MNTANLLATVAALASSLGQLGDNLTAQNKVIQDEIDAINVKLGSLSDNGNQAQIDEITASLTALGQKLTDSNTALAANTQAIADETTNLGKS